MKNMREEKTNSVYLDMYSEYTREDIDAIIDDLFSKARHLTNPKIAFESTMEPHEDYLGDVRVYVWGMRPATEEEIKEDCKEKELHDLAKEMGVTIYEAKVFQDLKKRGKI